MIKKVHLTCKDKTNINNEQWEKCIDAYKKIYSDYEIIIYDNNDIYCIVEKHFPHFLEDIKKIQIGAVLADIFRYLILYLEGGIYSDMDCEPIQKIDKLLNVNSVHFHGDEDRDNNFYVYPRNKVIANYQWDFTKNICNNCKYLTTKNSVGTFKCLGHNYVNENTDVIVCYEFADLQICQWFIISKPNQKVFLNCFKQCMDNIPTLQNLDKNSSEFNNLVMENCGPGLFTKMILNDNSSNICILPDEFFCCGSGSFVPKTKNSYVSHYFTGSWR